jgi:hypothetical protein
LRETTENKSKKGGAILQRKRLKRKLLRRSGEKRSKEKRRKWQRERSDAYDICPLLLEAFCKFY